MIPAPNPVVLQGHAAAFGMLTELIRNGAMTRASAERFAAGMIAGAAQFLGSGGNELWAAETLCRIADDACDRAPREEVAGIVRGRP